MEQFSFINTYADAIAAGSPLLYLPPELRNRIYDLVFASYSTNALVMSARDIEAYNLNWLPPICQIDDVFFTETLPICLRRSVFRIDEGFTAWNLSFFLHATDLFWAVQSLHLTQANVVRTGANAAYLLNDCINLRNLRIDFRSEMSHERTGRNLIYHGNSSGHDMSGLTTESEDGSRKISLELCQQELPLGQILQLKRLTSICFGMWPPSYFTTPLSLTHVASWVAKEFEAKGQQVKVIADPVESWRLWESRNR